PCIFREPVFDSSDPPRISCRFRRLRHIEVTTGRRAIFRVVSRALMAISCGIVGLPNVGKSTLFNALSSAGAAVANYPFCTIEPNIGVVPVPDARLDALVELYHPKSTVAATVNFVDIAGLVRGASKGEGLGNQFL